MTNHTPPFSNVGLIVRAAEIAAIGEKSRRGNLPVSPEPLPLPRQAPLTRGALAR
jgi:hypothetical protein